MTDTPDNVLLSVRDLSVSFKRGRQMTQAVLGISFDIGVNKMVALVGESGSGKSVTAMAVAGLLPDSAVIGEQTKITFDGKDLLSVDSRERRDMLGSEIGVVFQEPMSSLNPVLTVGYQVREVILRHTALSRREADELAVSLLEETGLADAAGKMNAYPHQLSGGQQQRVMIAMAIACEPKLLIADEPTTALDVTVQKQIMGILKRLSEKRGMSVLFITHDLQLAASAADEVVVMRYGRIRETGSAGDIFERPQDAYTKALMACRPPLYYRPYYLSTIDEIHEDNGIERIRGITDADVPVLSVRNLTKRYEIEDGFFGKQTVTAVDNVSFDVLANKTLGVVGESGSGKSTVAMIVAGLLKPDGGEVIYKGTDLAKLSPKEWAPWRRQIQMVFQNPFASLNPRHPIGQILSEPLVIAGVNPGEAAKTAASWIDKVGLPAASFHRYAHEFSGGQRQRIAIARALVSQPELLVCDEAVAALDVSVQAQILNLLQDLQEELSLSVLFITHDLAVVRYISDAILVMRRSKLIETASTDELIASPKDPYTRELMEAAFNPSFEKKKGLH